MLFPDSEFSDSAPSHPELQPLAARLRPRTFAEFRGQDHIVGPGKLLRRAIEGDCFTAIILYGPPGVGKTTLAELVAHLTSAWFERLSAVGATVADIRKCVAGAKERMRLQDGRRTILFLDEIHRFNRAQQDVLLPDVETGVIRLIGATTENPFFHIVGPLLSRAQVFTLEALSPESVTELLAQAVADERGFPGRTITIDDDAIAFLAQACEGDARRALGALELAVSSTAPRDVDVPVHIDLPVARESIQKKAVVYGDDGHYDTISAFIKSMRGSDPDAAVYWLAKMLDAGEDIRFIARRLVIFASEDVGNADPRALNVAVDAMRGADMVGMPEARIILAQGVTYCATCPKSNAACVAIDSALADVRSNRVVPVPKHLRDSHYAGAKTFGHGDGYQYPHDHPDHFADQDYLGIAASYYQPSDMGYEVRIRERMKFWAARRHGDDDEEAGDAE